MNKEDRSLTASLAATLLTVTPDYSQNPSNIPRCVSLASQIIAEVDKQQEAYDTANAPKVVPAPTPVVP